MANYTGNGTKSMHTSLKASLKKLNTDYIDLLYVHWWDFSASVSCTLRNTSICQDSRGRAILMCCRDCHKTRSGSGCFRDRLLPLVLPSGKGKK